jgi:hypothetical protein
MELASTSLLGDAGIAGRSRPGSSDGRAAAVVALLWMHAALGLTDAGIQWIRIARGTTDPLPNDMFSGVRGYVFLAGVLVTHACVIAFCLWIARAMRRARRGVGDARFTPFWSVVCWFLPVANLWLPLLVMRDLWRMSRGGSQWRRSPTPASMWVWWACLLFSNVLAMASWFAVGLLGSSLQSAGTLLDVVAASLAALLVSQITALQRAGSPNAVAAIDGSSNSPR